MSAWGCPMCSSLVARWVPRPSFTCHHCGWVLAADLSHAARTAVACAIAAEAALLSALWWGLGSASRAAGAYLGAVCGLGVCAWYAGFHAGLRIRPLRPPAKGWAAAAPAVLSPPQGPHMRDSGNRVSDHRHAGHGHQRA